MLISATLSIFAFRLKEFKTRKKTKSFKNKNIHIHIYNGHYFQITIKRCKWNKGTTRLKSIRNLLS